jgi:hypothetical protein
MQGRPVRHGQESWHAVPKYRHLSDTVIGIVGPFAGICDLSTMLSKERGIQRKISDAGNDDLTSHLHLEASPGSVSHPYRTDKNNSFSNPAQHRG